MVTRTNGAPAAHVKVPRPSILTSVVVVTIVGRVTVNDPK